MSQAQHYKFQADQAMRLARQVTVRRCGSGCWKWPVNTAVMPN